MTGLRSNSESERLNRGRTGLALGLARARRDRGRVLQQRDSQRSMCLVINFLLLAVLYFTLNAEMLGISQVAVYTGAIMVLFLFVIMLLNLGAPQQLTEKRFDPKAPRRRGSRRGALCSGRLLGTDSCPLSRTRAKPHSLDNFGSPQAIGRTLFSRCYAYPLEAVGILLLIGLAGIDPALREEANMRQGPG